MFCRTCQNSGHRPTDCPMRASGEGTTEGCFYIPRGGPLIPVGVDTLYFEVQFFKYNASPQYYVKYEHGPTWVCTCPYRVYHPQVMCKHCTACVHLKQGVRLPGGNYEGFLNWHIREMDADSFERIGATRVGLPLPQETDNKCWKVQYDDDEEAGYIEYRNRWHCWTCGGANGHKHLKGRMCKHIACYEKSLTDASYQQWVTEVEDEATFRQERANQIRVWQRFSLLTF